MPIAVCHRLLVADALEHRVGAEAAGQLAHALDRLVAALADDVGGAELRASAIRSGWRPSRMICSAPSRFAAITPQRPTAPSPTTATRLARRDARGDARRGGRCPSRRRASAATASARRPRRRAATTSVPSACGTRTASPWPPSMPSLAAAAAVQAGRCAALRGRRRRCRPTTRTARRRGRPALTVRDLGADVLDDADELVAHPLAGLARLHRLVRPEVAAADAGAGDADERVGGLDQARVGDVLDPDVAGAVHDSCAHDSRSSTSVRRTVTARHSSSNSGRDRPC